MKKNLMKNQKKLQQYLNNNNHKIKMMKSSKKIKNTANNES